MYKSENTTTSNSTPQNHFLKKPAKALPHLKPKDLTSQFFQQLQKYNGVNYSQASQYYQQKHSQFERGVLLHITQNDHKLHEIYDNQARLNQLSQDSSIFASTLDQIQQLNICIKDQFTEVQVENDEIKKQIDNIRTTQQHKKAIQTCVEMLDSRAMKAALGFKQLLTEHQQVIKKQEAKKEKLIGKGAKARPGQQNQRKMRILPHQYQADDRYSAASTANNSLTSEGDTLLMMGGNQDNSLQQRASSIQAIEKTLHDLSSMFKRFASIVQEQEVLVDRIDQNTEQALYDLEGAKKELREVYEDTKSTRKLILKIFFILMIFSTFYILFVL
eukprot:403344918